MALLSALNNAVSGLKTINQNIDVVADNIANAQTENYNRRSVRVEDTQHSGSRVAKVVRETNTALQREYRASLARSAASEVRYDLYENISNVLDFNGGESRLSSTMNEFISSWRDLQSAPENEAVPFTLENAAKDLASLLRELDQEITLLRQEVNNDIENEIENLNDLLDDVDALNNNVMSQPESSGARASFENERDEKLDRIAEIVDITVQRNTDGSLSVYTKTGITLIGGITNQFSWDRSAQKLSSDLSTRNLVDELPEGSLGARINLVKDYEDAAAGTVEASDPKLSPLQKFQDQIDALAVLLTKPSSTSNPTTFAGAFGAAVPYPVNEPSYPGPYNAYWENQLFVPEDTFDEGSEDITAGNFYVNDNLVPTLTEMGKNTDGVAEIVRQLTEHTRRVELNSMPLENQNYQDVMKAIQVNFSIRIERMYDLDQANQTSHIQISTNYRSFVGVSLDQEMARITVLQNSYAATAKVISTVNNMFDALERAI